MWDNLNNARPETSQYVLVGKYAWEAGLRDFIKSIHNTVSPVSGAQRTDREVYYHTLYDHIDPKIPEPTKPADTPKSPSFWSRLGSWFGVGSTDKTKVQQVIPPSIADI